MASARFRGNDLHCFCVVVESSFHLLLFSRKQIESMHLRWLIQPPPLLPFSISILRFNSSVNYGGLQFANSQEGIFFSENKDKFIHSALLALAEDDSQKDGAQVLFLLHHHSDMYYFFLSNNKVDTEQEFLALRRLVASKAGFSSFTNLPGFREKLGLKVVRALQRDRDHVTQSAIDVLCALMEPMYDESDLRQEQLNKSSLLSSTKFLEGTSD